jgi:hypothetical protein
VGRTKGILYKGWAILSNFLCNCLKDTKLDKKESLFSC